MTTSNDAEMAEREKRIIDGPVVEEDHRIVLEQAMLRLAMISEGVEGPTLTPAQAKCLGAEMFMLWMRPPLPPPNSPTSEWNSGYDQGLQDGKELERSDLGGGINIPDEVHVGDNAVAIGAGVGHVDDGEIVFATRHGATLRLTPDGRIWINGKFVERDVEVYEAFGNVFGGPKSTLVTSEKGLMAFPPTEGLFPVLNASELEGTEDSILVGPFVRPITKMTGDIMFANKFGHCLYISHQGWVKWENGTVIVKMKDLDEEGRDGIIFGMRQLMELDYTDQIK